MGSSSNGFTLNSIGIRSKGKDFSEPILTNDEIEVYFNYSNNSPKNIHVTVKVKSENGEIFLTTSSNHQEQLIKQGDHELSMYFPSHFFNDGSYYMDVLIVEDKKHTTIRETDVLSWLVNPEPKEIGSWMGKEKGFIKGVFEWK